MSAQAQSQRTRADLLLELADDELILGWRNSEWTGIAPLLEEDVAFSSIAQNEIGHARALYELAAAELGTTADELAFDRPPEEYRCAPLVELRLMDDWAKTVARHFMYETADELRVRRLVEEADAALAGLAAKIDREEVYHRMHAELWWARLRASDESRRRLEAAVEQLWPYAVGLLDEELRPRWRERMRASGATRDAEPVERGMHLEDWPALWEEMTMVRRSVPGATW
ncbi:MAG: 1,2-phenylacetyl-CoA epoxidase subunit PaaC [Gaiellaceae bacterium]